MLGEIYILTVLLIHLNLNEQFGYMAPNLAQLSRLTGPIVLLVTR